MTQTSIAESYTIEQVATFYGKSRQTIKRYVDAGLLTPIRIGKNIRFEADKLPSEIKLNSTTEKTI